MFSKDRKNLIIHSCRDYYAKSLIRVHCAIVESIHPSTLNLTKRSSTSFEVHIEFILKREFLFNENLN